jgi:membrane associated rhomboid family serine protease
LLPPATPQIDNLYATLSVLILLATFHNLTRLDIALLGQPAPDWILHGNAQAARILDHEWWRLLTSLTLHANISHLLSNLTIGGIFIILLCREIGSGLAWSLLLASGMLGNLANAHFNLPTHSSVGASTLVFGGVGILAAISMLRHRNYLNRRWPMPIAAAASLLAILGTEGENTDLGAHFFGFVFGILLGLVTGYLLEKYGRPARVLNALLSLGCALLVIYAWRLAIHN